MSNTRVTYWVKPVGEKKYIKDHIFLDVELNSSEEADNYMSFGYPGNHLIEDAVLYSKYGMIENWGIKKVQLYSDEDAQRIDEIREYEAQIKRDEKTIRDIKRETAKIKEKIKKIDEDTERELERVGWKGLTQDELAWISKQPPFGFFRPSVASIRAQYNEFLHRIDPEVEDRFKGVEEYRSTNGWLDPYGKYYPVGGFSLHNQWADEWLQQNDPKYAKIDHEYPYEALEAKGWLRIMDWGAGTEISFGYKHQPNHEQKEVLYLFCALHKIKNPFA
jgi:hypothetical protein